MMEEHNTTFPLEECHGCFFDDCHCLNQDYCFLKETRLSELLKMVKSDEDLVHS